MTPSSAALFGFVVGFWVCGMIVLSWDRNFYRQRRATATETNIRFTSFDRSEVVMPIAETIWQRAKLFLHLLVRFHQRVTVSDVSGKTYTGCWNCAEKKDFRQSQYPHRAGADKEKATA